jgi:hypothetical protein
LYFQLYPSTLPTEGTESGLLPTPETSQGGASADVKISENGNYYRMNSKGVRYGPRLQDVVASGLLKTPSAMDAYAENLSKKEQKFGNSGTLAQEIQSGFVEKRWPGLLATPQAMEDRSNPETWDARAARKKEEGINLQLGLTTMARKGMLPTPTAMDSTGATANMKSSQVKEGSMHSVTLARAMTMGMLPTPATRDYKGARSSEALEASGRTETNSLPDAFHQTGKSSQLSPRFVMEMMGFPTDWTELPFLNGDKNQ